MTTMADGERVETVHCGYCGEGFYWSYSEDAEKPEAPSMCQRCTGTKRIVMESLEEVVPWFYRRRLG